MSQAPRPPEPSRPPQDDPSQGRPLDLLLILPPGQPSPARPGMGRWLLLGALAVLTLGLVSRCGSGGPGQRIDPALLGPLDLEALGLGPAASWQVSVPPVDLGQAELAARAAAGGRLPAAGARGMLTHRATQGGREVNQALLRYASPAEAQAVEAVAAPLLERTFGLVRAPLDLPGTEGATAWHNASYSGASFRVAETLVFVGGMGIEPTDLSQLAAAARDRLRQALATADTAATASAPADPRSPQP